MSKISGDLPSKIKQSLPTVRNLNLLYYQSGLARGYFESIQKPQIYFII